MIFILALVYTTVIFLIKLIFNLKKINYRLNNLVNNWEKSPIKSIFLDEDNSAKNDWKRNSLIYERLSDISYNYKSIFYEYKYKESKICGKDSYDNDLYFPKDVECPINGIRITKDENFDTKGEYTKLNLKDNYFLYYTNKKIDGKIIINIINSRHNKPELNFHESEEKGELIDFDINSYSIIDTFNNEYLLSIFYIGIDPEISPKTGKINDFDDELTLYKDLVESIEIILFCYYGVMVICFFVLFCKWCENSFSSDIVCYLCGFTFAVSIFSVPIIIISSICLSINQQYVINFVNKINETYEYNKVNFSWEIMLLIHIIISIIFSIFTIIYYCNPNCFEECSKQLFICNLCECGECKTCKCDCDFGNCECLNCLRNCGCDCICNCFKCLKKDKNNNHIPNTISENININNIDITNEITPLKNMISNIKEITNRNFNDIKGDIIEIKNNINNQNNINNIKNNQSDNEIKEAIGNIRILCNDCKEKINNTNNNINTCRNEINKLQNYIQHMNNFNNEILGMKNDLREIKGICNDCLEKNKNNKINSENDNELKVVIRYENKIYQIIINNKCSYQNFIDKIYNNISTSIINSFDKRNIKLYYWNQLGEKNEIINENDWLNALNLHIFYFEVVNEKENQIKKQNYFDKKDK